MRKNDHYFILACITLLIAGIYIGSVSRESRVRLAVPLEYLPQEFGEFKGQDVSPLRIAFDEPTADVRVVRVYAGNGGNQPIYVFVGYWENQNEKKRIKSPRYVAEGWGYYWIKTRTLSQGSGKEMQVKEFLNERGDKKELVYYCYIIKGKIVVDEYRSRVLTMLNSLVYGKNNAALLRVALPVANDVSLDRVEQYGEAFIRDFLPLLSSHLPT